MADRSSSSLRSHAEPRASTLRSHAEPRASTRVRRIVCALLCVGSLACGGAAKNASYLPPTPEQERVFEHGVDFVAALEGLEGRWRQDWDRDLQERIGGADFIGIVQMVTLLTETDPEQRITYRLVGRVKRALYGEGLKDLELRVRDGQPGFATVHDNLQRIESREFVAFVKWYVDPSGERAAHFHLSPASEVIVSETERTVALKGKSPNAQTQERVIVHNN